MTQQELARKAAAENVRAQITDWQDEVAHEIFAHAVATNDALRGFIGTVDGHATIALVGMTDDGPRLAAVIATPALEEAFRLGSGGTLADMRAKFAEMRRPN